MKQTMHRTRNTTATIVTIVLVCVALVFLDMNKSHYGMAVSILQKAVIYSVVAVSMNLLNGFTGLFSLGQAGFMALGAYTTAMLTIPVANRRRCIIFRASPLAGKAQPAVSPCTGTGGLMAALFAVLIGGPVLRLKSDYLPLPHWALPRSFAR